MDFMNVWMKKEFGKKYVRKFEEYYHGDAKCFFVKDGKDVIAFGILNPVVVEYLDEKYDIFGMGDIVTIRRGEGYGRVIMEAMIDYLKKSGKTGIGFCARKNLPFYEKVGLKTKGDLMKRFRYRDPENGKVGKEKNGDGLFYNGKDNVVEEILKGESLAYLNVELW
jgi:GNAT superfamily N-acetyltransferase